MFLIKSYCKNLAQALLFWLIFFGIQRAIFLFYHWQRTFESSFIDIVYSYLIGFKLDFTATCYILTLQGIILLFVHLSRWKFFNKIDSGLNLVLIFFSSIIATIDLELFE